MPVPDGSPSIPSSSSQSLAGYSCPPAGCQLWPTPSIIPVPYLTQVQQVGVRVPCMYVYILLSQVMPLAPPVQAVASYIEDLVGKLLAVRIPFCLPTEYVVSR